MSAVTLRAVILTLSSFEDRFSIVRAIPRRDWYHNRDPFREPQLVCMVPRASTGRSKWPYILQAMVTHRLAFSVPQTARSENNIESPLLREPKPKVSTRSNLEDASNFSKILPE